MEQNQIERIRAKNAIRKDLKMNATSGPWYIRSLDDDLAMSLTAISTLPDTGKNERWPNFDSAQIVAATLVQAPRYVDIADEKWDENAEFICFARNDDVQTDIDLLLTEIDRLQNELTLLSQKGHHE